MKRRQYSLLRHLKSLCLMTQEGIEVEITHISKEPTNFMLRGKLNPEFITIPPKHLCWSPNGRYLLKGDHPLDLYVSREGEPTERLNLVREMGRLKLETRENRRKVVIKDVLGSYFPIRGYAEDVRGEIIDFLRLSWTQSGRWFNGAKNSPLDLMELIEE